MHVEEILKQYGPHGLYAAVLWRVLSWAGSRLDELLKAHQRSQVRLCRQMSRQTVLMKGMIALLKDQGAIVEEIRSRLNGVSHVAPQSSSPPTAHSSSNTVPQPLHVRATAGT